MTNCQNHLKIPLASPVFDIRKKDFICQALGVECIDVIYFKKAVMVTPGKSDNAGEMICIDDVAVSDINAVIIDDAAASDIKVVIRNGATLLFGTEAIEWLLERKFGDFPFNVSLTEIDCASAVIIATRQLAEANDALNEALNLIETTEQVSTIYACRRQLQIAADAVINNGAGFFPLYTPYGSICRSAADDLFRFEYDEIDEQQFDTKAIKEALRKYHNQDDFCKELINIAEPFISSFISQNYATVCNFVKEVTLQVVPPVSKYVWERVDNDLETMLACLPTTLQRNTAYFIEDRLIVENPAARLLATTFGKNFNKNSKKAKKRH